ncbi:HutD/Ves family protein [Methylobacterium brachiatum]|uniref:HutD/Ves family protein n=1 Tax=Methylobacterium brachiatum TaxID=269660 RepID=UPI002449F86F|nr:HutD family protein [Methylobacterium brachiatum]MDH2312376.1 HutD family protein [Methylobacterium brachiatum]
MRILPAETHKRMAWKNGGGETIEVAVHPAEADLSAFGWRVSMARVGGDGHFSVFEGVDRTISLLEGEGITLHIEGAGDHTMRTDSDPLRFPADAPTDAHLLGGSILDLNVMTRRGAFEHRVRRIRVGKAQTIHPDARWTLVLSLGSIEVEDTDSGRHHLLAREALMLEAGDPAVSLSATLIQAAFLIEIDATGPA